MTGTLSEGRAKALQLLKRYPATPKEEKTVVLRSLANAIVDCREHFTRTDGSPDWTGRTHPYRVFVRDLFSDARIQKDEQASIQAAIRYHVSDVLRERLDAETLETYGLIPQTARERSHDRREQRTALFSALTAREAKGGSLMAVLGAVALLQRVAPKDLDELSDAERSVAAESLADLERRIRAMRRRLAPA